MFAETDILLPLLQSGERDKLLKDEALSNKLLHINSETSRKRVISEVSKRYDTMAATFWVDYANMSEENRKVANFFVILKSYKLCFDFQINVTIRKWNGVSRSVTYEDLRMALNEIAAKDDFVDSWSDLTKKKIAGAYLTIMRKVGMVDQEGSLHPVTCTNFDYYLAHGESWFLEACLLQPYEIENIKKSLTK